MKKMLSVIIFTFIISLGIIAIFYQSNNMEKERILKKNRQEVVHLLQNKLEQFNPALDRFVDDDYKTVIGSAIDSNGISTFERGLAKNQKTFGNYIVTYDLEKMKVLSKELIIRDGTYADKWETFQKDS